MDLFYVRPVLECASPVLTLANPSTLGRLNLVQSAAIHYILGGLRSNHSQVFERTAAVEPLDLRRNAQGALARKRFLRMSEAFPVLTMSENPGRNQCLKKFSPLTRGKETRREHELGELRLPLVPVL